MARFLIGDRVYVPTYESWGTVSSVFGHEVKVFLDTLADWRTFSVNLVWFTDDYNQERPAASDAAS